MKVSIIIPIYNAEKFINKCLDSIVTQTFNNFEVIMINDGSTDKTVDKLNYYINKYNNFILINQQNAGPAAARNLGIKKSNGDFLSFVDSDDWLENDYLEKLVASAEKNNSDLVVCDYYENNGDLEENISSVTDLKEESYNLEDYPQFLNLINHAPWNKLYKKELFDKVVFPTGIKYEDLAVLPIIFHKAKNISFVKKPLYHYYINAIGETGTLDMKIFDMFKILNIVIDYYKNNNCFSTYYEELLKISDEKLVWLIERSFNFTDKRITKKFIKEAYNFMKKNFKTYPKDLKSNNDKGKVIRYNPTIYYYFRKYRSR